MHAVVRLSVHFTRNALPHKGKNGRWLVSAFMATATDVMGIFLNEAAIRRLVGAILLEQNDEWAMQRARHLTLEAMAPMSDVLLVSLPAVAI